MKHLLCLTDLGRDGLIQVLDRADKFKAERQNRDAPKPLSGMNVALVFEKASTRTRVSLEVAVNELGGSPIVLTSAGSQMDRGEPIEDTARVLSRLVQAITFRTFSEATLTRLAEFSSVPVLNALTDTGHPMQLLADLQTVRSEFSDLTKLKFAWVGDGNNMANSWIEAAGLLQLNLDLACPLGFEPAQTRIDAANALGAKVRLLTDPKVACEGAHVINTDVFASMGQEQEIHERRQAFVGMCVDEELLQHADASCIVLHCLPAHRGEEISEGVLEGPQSRVWVQAEARLHSSKAALCWALGV